MLEMIADTRMANNMKDWTFFGDGNGDAEWKQDHEDVIYPPAWSNKRFYRGKGKVPDLYAYELAKEDYAFLTSGYFDDVDISVKYKCFYGSVAHGGIIFRAESSTEFYVLDITDLGRKAHQYEMTLWAQYSSGYRKKLMTGFPYHSVVSEKFVQCGIETYDEWTHSSPDWFEVRIQATGTYIRVSADGNVIFDLRDSTYATGYTGLAARGNVCYKDLCVKGGACLPKRAFMAHKGEMPPEYFLPGGIQPEGFNAYPSVCCSNDGTVMAVWKLERSVDGKREQSVLFSKLLNGANEWSTPSAIYSMSGGDKIFGASSVYSHLNGDVTCILNESGSEKSRNVKRTFCLRSTDRGESWFDAGDLPIDLKTADGHEIHPYSPMLRISDNKVIMTGYEADTGSGEDNSGRKDRSVLYISGDDGYTWQGPVYFDKNNFDHNECMAVETAPDRMIAFMRTLRSKNMWMSRSSDGGMTWSPLIQSDVTGECPYIIRHSSGALVFFSRGYGSFIKLSFDEGITWTSEFRISPASAMIGMTETKDGRIIIIMHEGYRVPGRIRGQFFDITAEGPVPANNRR